MPDDRLTRSAQRCDLHPASPSVAMCDGCGRPLCISCAVPVRGRVLGAECLADAIGSDVSPDVVPAPGPSSVPWALIGASFAVATGATILPWTRFGEGSGLFGAWGSTAEWSLLAAVAAAAGLALWLLGSRTQAGAALRWVALAAGFGALVMAASILAAFRPPPFTRPWIGPWIACLGGATAFGAAIAAIVRMRERATSNV